jgi:ABC-2 type transport system permease protein/lipopolysaccharide transport system permease protein
MLLAIPGAATILMFGYFTTLVFGPICARFRDIPLVVQSLMQVIFFMTPIFWMPSAVSHRPMFIQGNPFYHFIQLIRAPLLGEPATPLNWQVALWCCGGAAFLSLIVVAMTRKRLTLWL